MTCKRAAMDRTVSVYAPGQCAAEGEENKVSRCMRAHADRVGLAAFGGDTFSRNARSDSPATNASHSAVHGYSVFLLALH